MPKPLCLVTRPIPEAALKALSERFEIDLSPEDRVIGREALLAGVSRADAILCMLTDAIDQELIQAAPKLKYVATYSVGFNHIDLKACKSRDIQVINTPHALTNATADLAFALILDIARGVSAGDRSMRKEHGFPGWGPLYRLGREVTGKTLGLVGFGRIGQAVARRAKGFDMKVLYCQRHALEASQELAFGVQRAGLDELLAQSDFVSLHCPLSPDTQHLLDYARLKSMRLGAYLINTARGPVVDERALVQVLREGHLAGAALDVYEREPKLEAGLVDLEQVTLLPHLGSATEETRLAMGLDLVQGLAAILDGQTPNNILN